MVALKAKQDAEMAAAERTHSNAIDKIAARTEATQDEQLGERFAASERRKQAEDAEALRNAPADEKDKLAIAQREERATRKQEHQLDIAKQVYALDTKEQQANLQAARMPKAAEATGEVRALAESVINADPEVRAKAKSAALAQLGALAEKFAYKSGGEALEVHAGERMGPDPLGLRKATQDRRAAQEAVEKGRGDIGAMKVGKDRDANTPILEQMRQLLQTISDKSGVAIAG
jgi:hypothetical protein